MDIVWQGLLRNFDHLRHLLFSVGSEFSLSSLVCALAVAAAFLIYRCARQGRRVRLRALTCALFPRRIARSPSTVADFGYFLFNTFVYPGIFGMAAASYQFLTNGVLSGLIAAFGAPAPSTLAIPVSRAIITVMLFLTYELGY